MFEILLLANYEYLFENIRRTSAAVTCIQLKGKLKKLGSKLETPVGYVLEPSSNRSGFAVQLSRFWHRALFSRKTPRPDGTNFKVF